MANDAQEETRDEGVVVERDRKLEVERGCEGGEGGEEKRGSRVWGRRKKKKGKRRRLRREAMGNLKKIVRRARRANKTKRAG
jgi:hypothetical protein